MYISASGYLISTGPTWLLIVAEEPAEFLLLTLGKFWKGLMSVFLFPPRVLLAEDGVRENADEGTEEGVGVNTLSKLNPLINMY